MLVRVVRGVVDRLAPAVAGGALVGVVGIGVVSRLAMRLLALTSDADGLQTDDGFEVGRFTLAGSVNLVMVGLFLGAALGVLAPAVGAVAPPGRWRILPGAALGATVGAALLVKDEGVDFTVLGPRPLAIALFIAVPGLIGGAVVPVVDRLADPGGRFAGLPLPVRLVFVLPLVLPPILVFAVFTAIVRAVAECWPRFAVASGRFVMSAIALAGLAQLVRTSAVIL